MYSWVHGIATPEENDILLTGSNTDDRGMTSPNLAKVSFGLKKSPSPKLPFKYPRLCQQEDHGQDRAGSVSENGVIVTHGEVASATNLAVD